MLLCAACVSVYIYIYNVYKYMQIVPSIPRYTSQ